MNYNLVFAPTARAGAFIKGHAENLTTYALIAAVIILQGAEAVLEFIDYHAQRRELYGLNIRVAQLRTQTFFIRRKLSAVRALYRVLSNPVVLRVTLTLKALWTRKGQIVSDAFDTLLCLEAYDVGE